MPANHITVRAIVICSVYLQTLHIFAFVSKTVIDICNLAIYKDIHIASEQNTTITVNN